MPTPTAAPTTQSEREARDRLAEIREWHQRASAPDAEGYGLDAHDANELVGDVGWLLERNAALLEACRTLVRDATCEHDVRDPCWVCAARAAIAAATGEQR